MFTCSHNGFQKRTHGLDEANPDMSVAILPAYYDCFDYENSIQVRNMKHAEKICSNCGVLRLDEAWDETSGRSFKGGTIRRHLKGENESIILGAGVGVASLKVLTSLVIPNGLIPL